MSISVTNTTKPVNKKANASTQHSIKNGFTYRKILYFLLWFLLGFNIRLWLHVLECRNFFHFPALTSFHAFKSGSEIIQPQNAKSKRVRRNEPTRDIYKPPLFVSPTELQGDKIRLRTNVVRYQAFDDYYLYDQWENEPKISLPKYDREMHALIVDDIVKKINGKNKKIKWAFQKILNGLKRYIPGYGTVYHIDLRVKYNRTTGPLVFRTYKTSVFHPLENHRMLSIAEVERSSPALQSNNFGLENDYNTKLNYDDQAQKSLIVRYPVINVILPLGGKTGIFERFAKFLNGLHVNVQYLGTIYVVLFVEETPDEVIYQLNVMIRDFQLKVTEQAKNLKKYSQVNCEIKIIPVDGSFNRGLALHKGIMEVEDKKALLLLCDADMIILPKFLRHCQQNTELGKSVYYPTVFSQYKPEIVTKFKSFDSTRSNQTLSDDNEEIIKEYKGHWVHYGFGIVCLYKQDYLSVGGFNLNITGWGVEDVELYEKHVLSPLKVFRAFEPNLYHVYHDKFCDSSLKESQYHMCLDTKSETLGSKQELARKILLSKLQ